ncbi:MAG TPA: hypothetical protein PLW72_15470 [Burkholderiaceae bacterium]|nr:hypothetical protein [Burkholderiaceae bacterium]HQR74918.1 hypothetical protein [Burkholderiaceae bacterium]
MAEAAELLPPIEIPWQLAATTQPLSANEPEETALSLFFFEPDDATLTSKFPDDRIVFVKYTASISPAKFPAELSKVAASFLGEGIPCYHVLLDLKVRNAADEIGTIRPYFHTAAPLARRMVQTGVVGVDAYEGEADALAIGKSGSQMNESLRSHSNTLTASASAGFSIGPFGASGSIRNTTTDVASNRAVSQVVDTTNREASEERRELVSHTTRVENIISLLSAKYIGTPHLSFSVSPQPLQQLSVDPSDPNLWFQQLLARRSSGIEGIQEFTAVIVVPRGTDFCISARLRRVCLLDSPPGPFSLDERFTGTLVQLSRMVNYLNDAFPIGTPLEELDIDIIGGLTGSGPFRRPVVELWGLRLLESLVVASVVSPGASAGVAARGRANYKHFLEVWLDTLRDEYEREASRSPLERGVLFGENRFLDTCFATQAESGQLAVAGSKATVSPLFRVRIDPGSFDIGGLKTLSASQNTSTRARALETTTRWNTIERQVMTLLANSNRLQETPLAANDPKVLGVMVDIWRKLPADDPRNLEFDKAASLLQLGDAHRRLLKSAGATNLSGIASVLRAAPAIDRQNAEVEKIRTLSRNRKLEGPMPDPIKFPVTPKDGTAILGAIGAGLGGRK